MTILFARYANHVYQLRNQMNLVDQQREQFRLAQSGVGFPIVPKVRSEIARLARLLAQKSAEQIAQILIRGAK